MEQARTENLELGAPVSGLVALFGRDGRPASRAAVDLMLDAAQYRGPDGVGRWVSGPVGLGHARMAVTPEDELERQPLVSPRTGCVLVSDARLDNRADLLARFPSVSPLGRSDAELMLLAYETWGVDAASHLLGDFAFVVWDPRERRLVCARDTSGQRSLFYRYRSDEHLFAAASEIQQLFQDPAVAVVPNEERIRDFLTPINMFRNEKDQTATFFEGIRSLAAGHVLVVDGSGVAVRRYWDFSPPAEIRYRTRNEYADHYRDLLFEVVRSRLRSSRPVGVLLSGGLDSSSVACTAQEIYRAGQAENRGFVAFSFAFDGLECDEQGYVEDIRAKYGFDLRLVRLGEFAGRLQTQPRGFLEAPNQGIAEGRDAVFGEASDAGVRVLLTGDLADGCVGGSWHSFDSLLRHGRARDLWRHLRAYRRLADEPLRTTLALGVVGPLLPLGLQKRLGAFHVRRSIERNRDVMMPGWMPEPFRQEMVDRDLRLALDAERGRRFSSPSREHEYRLLYPPEVARHPVPWALEILAPIRRPPAPRVPTRDSTRGEVLARRGPHELLRGLEAGRPPGDARDPAGERADPDFKDRVHRGAPERALEAVVRVRGGLRAREKAGGREARLRRPGEVLGTASEASILNGWRRRDVRDAGSRAGDLVAQRCAPSPAARHGAAALAELAGGVMARVCSRSNGLATWRAPALEIWARALRGIGQSMAAGNGVRARGR